VANPREWLLDARAACRDAFYAMLDSRLRDMLMPASLILTMMFSRHFRAAVYSTDMILYAS